MAYTDIKSCFEPTVENRSAYVTWQDDTKYFYCGNARILISGHFIQSDKPMDKLIENVIPDKPSYNKTPLNRLRAYAYNKNKSIVSVGCSMRRRIFTVEQP